MIVFAAFMPHTPLLLESIGKENRRKLKKTLEAVRRVGEGLRQAAPDAVMVISAHPTRHADAFSISVHDPYRADLSRFGDLGTEASFQPDLRLIDGIQRRLRRDGLPLTLDTDPALDHGASVPLLALFAGGPAPKVVAVTYSGLDAKDHAAFGRALRDAIEAANERVAVIASGDLSHALDDRSPVPAVPEGKAFDDAVQRAVAGLSLSQLLSLDPRDVRAAEECAYRPLLILFGILDKIAAAPHVLAYEAPFGVGYLTADFTL